MEILRFPAENGWLDAARRDFLEAVRSAEARGSRTLRLCLAGGRTPGPVYRALARTPLRGLRVELWLGDEREVDPGSPDRNGGLVVRAFRDCVWDPAPDLVPWPDGPAPGACRSMEARLAALGEPYFDLSFLGAGEDGHTAGVFPGGPELEETLRRAVPSEAPAEPRARMTLTPRALASTRELRFLLRGTAKLALARRLAGNTSFPAGPAPGTASLLPVEAVARLARAAGAGVSLLYCLE